MLKTVSVTLEDELLQRGEAVSQALHLSFSAFMQQALQLALQRQRVQALEQQHQQGYRKHPVTEDEFSDWEDEQAWGDE